MKKFFLLLSIFTLSVGFAYSPAEKDVQSVYVLHPYDNVAQSDVLTNEVGIKLTHNEIFLTVNPIIPINGIPINNYSSKNKAPNVTHKGLKLYYNTKLSKKSKTKHIRYKRRLSDTNPCSR